MPARNPDQYEDGGYGEASRYAAHLDRGWAMLEQGDTEAARVSAEHAEKARPDDPDAAVLLGAIALAEGDPDDSLRCYERALELDPEYLEPYAAAAQVCLFDLDDPTRALRFCEDALDLEGLTAFERLDLGLMASECELAQGSDTAARARLDGLADVSALQLALELGSRPDEDDEDDELEIDLQTDRGVALAFLRLDPEGEHLDDEERVERVGRALQFVLRLARLRIDLGQAGHATELMTQVTDWYPRDADAWYLQSEAAWRGGDAAGSCQAAMRTLELDGESALPGWTPSPAMVQRKILSALRTCSDPTLRGLIEGQSSVAILVRESPPTELVMEGVDPRIAALALGSRPGGTAPDDAAEPPATMLTGLAVYRRSLARYARDGDHFEQELRLSILDELATFLGIDDARREALGLGPLPPSARASAAVIKTQAPGGHTDLPEAPPPDPEAKEAKRRRRRRARR